MPFGFKEVEGIHSRTNFDLSQHEKFSGKNIKYFDPETNESYTPYVIETSIGVDRMFLSIMSASYCEEQLENGETRVVLKLPAALAPVKLAVMPLVKKDGLPEKAREIINDRSSTSTASTTRKTASASATAVRTLSVRHTV